MARRAAILVTFSVGCTGSAGHQAARSPYPSGTSTTSAIGTGTATGSGVLRPPDGMAQPPAVMDGGVVTPSQPPAAADLSLGGGGPLGAIEQRFTASNGLSSTYKTIVPVDIGPQRPYGLTIHLHGDGGGDYEWLYEDNVRIGATHGLIGVVVLAPDSRCCWYEEGEANAVFLDDLIQRELFLKYNIDRRRVYFSGVSGGSQFLSGQFIPLFGSHYNSGAVMLCGGPENWLDTIQSTPEFIRNFRLYWRTNTGDFLYDQVQEGIEYYQGLGMNVQSDISQGGSHCDFPEGIDGALAAKLPLVLH